MTLERFHHQTTELSLVGTCTVLVYAYPSVQICNVWVCMYSVCVVICVNTLCISFLLIFYFLTANSSEFWAAQVVWCQLEVFYYVRHKLNLQTISVAVLRSDKTVWFFCWFVWNNFHLCWCSNSASSAISNEAANVTMLNARWDFTSY